MLTVLFAAALVLMPSSVAALTGDSGGARTAVLVLGLLLPLAVLSDTLLAITRGHATMLPTVAVERVLRPLLQLGLVGLVAGAASLTVLATAWSVPWAASAALAAWWSIRLTRRLASGPPTAAGRGPWREFWSFTWPRSISSVVQLALQRLDIVLVTMLIGPAQAAVYTAATRFLVVGQLGSTAVSTAAQPQLAGLLATDDRRAANGVYRSATAWIVLLTWPLYLLSAVFADVLLGVFGPGYASGRSTVVVLALAMLVSTACGMVTMLLNMAGRTVWTLADSLAALGVMVAVDVLLIPRIGILGAAAGWAAAIVLVNGLPLLQLVWGLGMHPFGGATLRAAALTALCFGVLPGTARVTLGVGPALAVALLAGALFTACCVRWRPVLGLPHPSDLRRDTRTSTAASTDASLS